MNNPLHNLNKNALLASRLILIAALMLATSASIAEESNIAYVDSVHKWGAWELDLEPAAGGLQQPSTKALNARDSKVVLRTNSFSALAPQASPAAPVIPGTPVTPPVIPVPPPTRPTITPINPGVPIPVGGPGGGAAPAPTITTISPNVPIPVGGPGGPGAS